jgi:hypothetical protein
LNSAFFWRQIPKYWLDGSSIVLWRPLLRASFGRGYLNLMINKVIFRRRRKSNKILTLQEMVKSILLPKLLLRN